uniref:Uncharacterized protein n=1 Tax=Amphimedon queenslandica TaxID=400682 RepID=A0A1X7V3S5_AMPQE
MQVTPSNDQLMSARTHAICHQSILKNILVKRGILPLEMVETQPDYCREISIVPCKLAKSNPRSLGTQHSLSRVTE